MILRTVKLVLLTLIVIGFVDFAIVNRATVNVSVFPFPYFAQMPEFLLIIICFGAGALVGGIMVSLKLSKKKHYVLTERKRVLALENELKGRKAEQERKASALIKA